MINWAVLHSAMTVADLQKWKACNDGYEALRDGMGWPKANLDDQDPNLTFTLRDVLEKGRGIEDAVWAMRCLPDGADPAVRIFAARCAARVCHLSDDPRVWEAIEAAVKFAAGDLDADGLAAARSAAMSVRSAAMSAMSAWSAADDAAWWSADDAARSAADAAMSAADADDAARYAAWSARSADDADDAAWSAAWSAQESDLIELLESPPDDPMAWVMAARQGVLR